MFINGVGAFEMVFFVSTAEDTDNGDLIAFPESAEQAAAGSLGVAGFHADGGRDIVSTAGIYQIVGIVPLQISAGNGGGMAGGGADFNQQRILQNQLGNFGTVGKAGMVIRVVIAVSVLKM